MRGALSLSVVIPTLNAAATLPGTLAALAWDDVVISDGGSTDGTRDIAGIRLVASPRGRGVQIAAGVAALLLGAVLYAPHYMNKRYLRQKERDAAAGQTTQSAA